MVLAVAALIAAFAGTAVAVDKITSKDIKPDAVRSKHIKAGQVKVADVDLVRHVRRAGAVATANTTAHVPITPALAVKAKRGDLLTIHGRVDASKTSTGSFCGVWARLTGPVAAEQQVARTNDSERLYPSPDMNSAFGSRPITVPIAEAGTYRVSLLGGTELSSSCSYAQRNLWVGLVR